jgi:hypothetical protein
VKNTNLLEIIDKLKKFLNIKTDKEIAKALKIDTGNYSKQKKNNTIPFKNIIDCCIFNNIDLNYIFKNEVKITNDEKEILKLISKLNEKEKKLYIYEIKARILRKELDE